MESPKSGNGVVADAIKGSQGDGPPKIIRDSFLQLI